MTTGPAVGWVGETAARPQTNSPVLDSLSFPAAELYAMPAATPTLLEDTAVNIDEWLAAEVEQAFAEQEGAAFVSGDGTNKPKGFLSYTNVANASWSWGNIGYIATGVDGGWAASNPSDILVDLIYAVCAGYRQNGTFVMNRKVQAAVRKFKDSTGHYLWQPPVVAGGRASLMTFPVIEAEDMPDIATNSYSVASGDFRRGYLIVDRQGVRVLRDPYLRLVLHDQARRRRRAGLRRDQAFEVRGVVTSPTMLRGRARARVAPSRTQSGRLPATSCACARSRVFLASLR